MLDIAYYYVCTSLCTCMYRKCKPGLGSVVGASCEVSMYNERVSF